MVACMLIYSYEGGKLQKNPCDKREINTSINSIDRFHMTSERYIGVAEQYAFYPLEIDLCI